MRIYFAGSIRAGCSDQELYQQIIELLRKYGEVLTEHVASSNLNQQGEATLSNAAIHDRDLAWLKSADYVIAEVTTPSLGVGYEIAKSIEWNKDILCLYRPTKGQALSAMIAGCSQIQICYYQDCVELKSVFDRFFSTKRAKLVDVSGKQS